MTKNWRRRRPACCARSPLAFLQYPGADPTNNVTGQDLRYVVAFRKISGRIKGGSRAMKRMPNFVSCVLTWRRQGLSVAEEVAKIV